mmetsp:Transcript_29243/g.86527  ORF Transcript_29243/g.86527 Transcript_29243/m.86527 type:complete len:213 (+) Transcript_29243:767-1405(+)
MRAAAAAAAEAAAAAAGAGAGAAAVAALHHTRQARCSSVSHRRAAVACGHSPGHARRLEGSPRARCRTRRRRRRAFRRVTSSTAAAASKGCLRRRSRCRCHCSCHHVSCRRRRRRQSRRRCRCAGGGGERQTHPFPAAAADLVERAGATPPRQAKSTRARAGKRGWLREPALTPPCLPAATAQQALPAACAHTAPQPAPSCAGCSRLPAAPL